MKIAYLIQMADLTTENGITKKIRSQTSQWIGHGHQVRCFALRPTSALWSGLDHLDWVIQPYGNMFLRSRRSRTLCTSIQNWQPDVIYFRFGYSNPGLAAVLRKFPTIAEFNSQDLDEYPLTLPTAKLLYHRLTRGRLLRSCAAGIAVTREIADYYAKDRVPCITLGNAIDLTTSPSLAAEDTASTSVLFIGSRGAPWHGLDRLAEIARLFPQVIFEVIGYDTNDWRCTAGIPVPQNCHLHGYLTTAQYTPLLAGASVAIGSLALFRNRMDEACPLKVREYLALGLPVIGAYRDTDIPDDADYFLRLPNNAESLAPWRDRIAAFLESWRGRRVPRATIAHLDVSVKEAQRLAFMERIVSEFRPHHD